MSSFLRFRRSRGPIDLAVGMVGIRMGERFLHVGAGVPRVFAIVSSKVGLTGRACAVVDTAEAQATLERAAAEEGVLVEVELATAGEWPYESSSFDVAVVDGNVLLAVTAETRHARLADTARVVRSGGRVIVICRHPRGLAARLGFGSAVGAPTAEALAFARALEVAGCRPVRVLAEREGLTFVEGFRAGA